MMKIQAIQKFHPEVATLNGNDAFDFDGKAVSYDEIAVQAEMAANAYKVQRAAAYPSIADQLDLLYHGGFDTWKAAITAVKEEFPK